MGFFDTLFGNKKYSNIDGTKFEQMEKDNKDLLILDVRTPDEFKSGHIPNAKNIHVGQLSSKISTLEKYKDKNVVVYCASGGRSISAALTLSKNGFNNVYNLGGIRNYKGKLK